MFNFEKYGRCEDQSKMLVLCSALERSEPMELINIEFLGQKIITRFGGPVLSRCGTFLGCWKHINTFPGVILPVNPLG